MKVITTNGFEFLIDDSDAHILHGRNWFVNGGKYHNGAKYHYAAAHFQVEGKRKILYLHRLIMNAERGEYIDHINGDTLDNRRENLRISNNKLNQANQRKIRGISKYKGVSLDVNGKWRARIREGEERLSLGSYALEIDAARAYDDAAKRIWGEYAGLNFPIDKRKIVT